MHSFSFLINLLSSPQYGKVSHLVLQSERLKSDNPSRDLLCFKQNRETKPWKVNVAGFKSACND